MEDILQKIAEAASTGTDIFEAAQAAHGGTRSEFSDTFAKELTLRYLQEFLDFDIAVRAINALSGWAGLENFSEFTWAIYRAFDEGEYLHEGQSAGSNEEFYTLPMLRRAMSKLYPQIST